MSPLILVSPSTQKEGAEFHDLSLSLSESYTNALLAAGALPLVMPPTTSRKTINELVAHCDGVLLTGGDDIQTGLYAKDLPPELSKTVDAIDPARDAWELELIDETFQKRKPLLGICRGHQLVNIALGGTLIVDIPTQVPNALNHRQFEKKAEPVHDLELASGCLLERLAGKNTLGVNSTHHQAVGKLAKALIPVGRTADGVVEALELKEPELLPFFLTVQFHPERLYDKNELFLRIFQCFAAACEKIHGTQI